MVRLIKSMLPEGIKIKRPEDYQTGRVFQTLCDDCYGKCYICEHKPIPPVVEHLVAHKGNPDLKYCWNNMFLACVYCNIVKNKRVFDRDIINPAEIDPEEFISLELQFEGLKEVVIVKPINDAESEVSIDRTIELLDAVYNNTSDRDGQKVSSANLKNMLSKNMRDFYLLIENYKAEHDSGSYENISSEISRSSEFAAFKRMVVRCDPELISDFAKVLQ